MIFAAHDLGFSPEAEFRDRTQMQFIALLVRQGASRLILKGGMAMRALYGSTRLTKDVDFDCEDNVSQQSMHTHMNRALLQAARLAGLTAAEVLPYIAPEMRQAIDEARWDEIRLDVAHHVERWMDEAIARAQPPRESDHVPNTDIDLAGR